MPRILTCGGPMDGQKFTVRQLPPEWCVPIPLDVSDGWDPLTEIPADVPIRIVTYHLTGLVTSDGYVLYFTAERLADLHTAITREVIDTAPDPYLHSWAQPATMSGKNPYPLDDLIAKIDDVTGDGDA